MSDNEVRHFRTRPDGIVHLMIRKEGTLRYQLACGYTDKGRVYGMYVNGDEVTCKKCKATT